MNKFPFTEEGFQKLLSELYALPNPALEEQATALLNDYRAWVGEHFSLSSSQLTFLNRIDNRFVDQASILTHSFMVMRQPIVLIKSSTSETKAEGEGKIIDLDKKSKVSYSEHGGFEESESLSYTISYKANE